MLVVGVVVSAIGVNSAEVSDINQCEYMRGVQTSGSTNEQSGGKINSEQINNQQESEGPGPITYCGFQAQGDLEQLGSAKNRK